MNRKSIAYAGISLCSVFILVTFMLIVTSSKIWLTAFEIITMISGIFMLLLILFLPSSENEVTKPYRIVSVVFVTGNMILTNVTHFVNLAVTEKLIRSGMNIPDYFQIGKWPSIEMAIDYLAWGMFMGLAFLASFMFIPKEKGYKKLKYTLLICGILCVSGFLGAMINENLWYLAPMGYGVGTIVICIELLVIEKISKDSIMSIKSS
ncbi:hypothetical protein [Clostridium intestinale]|uniref:hypothetical protein n=1 Tax=Clostridium intestinale TaxID=36845 RepID=UPI002DD68013|nr:hypothetical protein [Clostridium intestinale]WRY52219.1 hypothetical protein P8F83_03270 [Clostridium intestinale]